MLIPAPPHDVPAGPIAARWLGYELPALVAGTTCAARVAVENAGSATWRSQGKEGVQLASHWLDPLGNPIVWDGVRSALERHIGPGERADLPVTLEVPMPPGDYRLAFDLVHEHRFWFAELGSPTLDLPVTVLPRMARRAIAVQILGEAGADETRAALAAQEEPVAAEGEATAYLAAGCVPAPDWSRRILDAHEEGFAAVGGSVEVEGGRSARGLRKALEPWAPGFGRAPEWTRPLLCPSLLVDALLTEFEGVPAVDPRAIDGPVLCDGRIRVRLPGGRPRA